MLIAGGQGPLYFEDVPQLLATYSRQYNMEIIVDSGEVTFAELKMPRHHFIYTAYDKHEQFWFWREPQARTFQAWCGSPSIIFRGNEIETTYAEMTSSARANYAKVFASIKATLNKIAGLDAGTFFILLL